MKARWFVALALHLALATAGVAEESDCTPRKTCSKIHTCEDATWYLEHCSWGQMLDRDSDGAPCESICGSNN